MDRDHRAITFSPSALEGLRLYNQRLFFEAHEALEDAWRKESGPVRTLYQGILQVGVGLYHLERGNPAGARKVFERAWKILRPWQKIPLPYHLDELIARSRELDEIARNHPEKLQYLTVDDLFIPIQLQG